MCTWLTGITKCYYNSKSYCLALAYRRIWYTKYFMPNTL